MILPVELFLKSRITEAQPFNGEAEKPALGLLPALIKLVLVRLAEHPCVVATVKETLYLPSVVYVCVGSCWFEVPPSPKFHSQLCTGALKRLEVSLKTDCRETQPESPAGTRKFILGVANMDI